VLPLADNAGNAAARAFDFNDAVSNQGGSSAAGILQQSFYQSCRVEGAVLRGPATQPLKTYAVTVEGDIGRVEVPVPQEAGW